MWYAMKLGNTVTISSASAIQYFANMGYVIAGGPYEKRSEARLAVAEATKEEV